MDTDKHREEIRRLVAEAPDEPTYCEFKQTLSYASKKEKGELVKDVSSFANADLEALGGYGYIIFGVSNDGQVVGIGNLVGDPPSDTRKIVNGYLDRSILFEYLTCEVDHKAGGTKQVAAIVVPDSRRRPHVASREIKEHLNNKDKFWLREGNVWVRKTGGRELATAEDFDAMYEGKLRSLVDERVRPLQETIERLERDLREQRSAVPELAFGFAAPNSVTPSHEAQPYPVLGSLIDAGQVLDQIKRAEKQAAAKAAEASPRSLDYSLPGPISEDFEAYQQALEVWMSDLADLFVAEFVLVNTGNVPAEDVQVVLEVPAVLRPREWLPEKPDPPRNPLYGSDLLIPDAFPTNWTKQNSPDSLIGPEICNSSTSGTVEAMWEVGKLYHDRPLFTRSDADEVNGLLISGKGLGKLLAQVGGGAELKYAVRAANIPSTLRGAVVLKRASQ